eukprot:TRINITY_DN23347_c0_g1_i1.p2 TRINITY_DN23347_c0_g1~~TRINITY_DN23347_c0_g1_i1.p2  ORF type:complete len:120 (+),score=47.73 TRINITY_DN23347_c0_g1_i1:102-461(+)
MGAPVLIRLALQAMSFVGSAAAKAAFDAYRMEAARNTATGVAGVGRQARQMDRKQALEVLNVQPQVAGKLTAADHERIHENYTKFFEANAPDESGGPGGSPYLQGKVLAAYQTLEKEKK